MGDSATIKGSSADSPAAAQVRASKQQERGRFMVVIVMRCVVSIDTIYWDDERQKLPILFKIKQAK
jgi:hypothetical protein